MSQIHIRSAAQSWSASSPRTFVVGREPSCDIVVEDASVSRRHAEIRAAGDGWEIVDLGSSAGTWVGGQRVPRAPLVGTTTVRLGDVGGGSDLTVTVTPVPAAAPPPNGQPTPAPPTRFGPATGAAPVPAPPTAMGPAAFPAAFPATAPAPAPATGPDATLIPRAGRPGLPGGGGPGVLVRERSGDRQFDTHQPVRIGRDPALEVVAENPLVSRLHAVLEPRPDGWWLRDMSASGTYIDGERVTAHRLTEPVTVLLGHPTAGYELDLVPVVEAGVASAGLARRRRNKTLALVGGALAVLLLVGGGIAAAVVLGGDDSDSGDNGAPQAAEGGEGLDRAELDRAKAATVYLLAVGPDGSVVSGGSGSIISDDGLVLSNAHVANPAAPGMGGAEVDYVEVYFTTPDDDAPVELRYRAEPIVSDGYLDITVAQITSDGEGSPVEADELDLPEPLPLGDSDELRTLDEITALGYPDLSRANSDAEGLPTLTVTKGTVAAFNNSEVIGDPRSEIDADLRIGSGNSGGPSINGDGEIIGLNTRVFTENLEEQIQDEGTGGGGGIFTGGSARVVPINLADEVLRIAEEGGDPSYVSPFLAELPDPQEEVTNATITQHGWSPDGSQGTCTGTSTFEQPQIVSVAPGDVVHAEFTVTGLAADTPIEFVLFTLDGATELQRDPVTWDDTLDGQCIFLTYTVPEGVSGLNAVPAVGDQFVVDNPLQFQ